MKIKFCLICIYLFVIFTTKAQSYQWLQAAKIKEDSALFQQASILYERILFDNGNEEEVTNSIFGKLRCLKKMNAFKDAIGFIKSNIVFVKQDSLKYELYEQWITLTYLTHELDQCLNLIEQAKILYKDWYNMNWLTAVSILCLNEQNKWNEAKLLYTNWLKLNNADTSVIVKEYSLAPKLKSEDKAGWLSTFIPGAGQFYAGKPWEALTSILIQGIGIYYGVYSFQEKYYVSAWLVGGGIFGSFHFGSTRRSEELVKQYNIKQSSKFNNRIKEQIIQFMQLKASK